MSTSNRLPLATRTRPCRRSHRAFALALSSTLLVACASPEPEPTPIEDLFRDALVASRVGSRRAEDAARSSWPKSGASLEASSTALDSWSMRRPDAGPNVSDVFVQTDVREAIQALALQAHKTIVIDEVVSGTASAAFDEVSFEEALYVLLLPLGYLFTERDGTYFVGAAEPDSALFPYLAERFEYRPEHVEPLELLGLLAKNAKRFARASGASKTIVIHAPRQIAKAMLRDLAGFDRPVPQVVLEAIICSYAPEDRRRFGLDFEGGGPAGSDFWNASLKGLSGAAMLGPAGMDQLQSFRFTSVFLEALDSEGYVSVRAAPRVMAQDGERAVISIGKETYFTVGDGNNLLRGLKPVQTGIILNIVPHIRGSRITVEIERAEVSDEVRPSQLVASASDGLLPTVNIRRVSTTVHVKDGHTIVIGGLVQRREVKRLAKVPILGDIPLLGRLFQKVDNLEEEIEVAIFLSPRVVRSQP